LSERKKNTVRDVAILAGVSVSVVSRVLNSASGGVSEPTRRRVREAIQSLRYCPQDDVQQQPVRAGNTLALLVPDLSDDFCAELCALLIRQAGEMGLSVMVQATQDDPLLEREILNRLISQPLRAIIALPVCDNSDRWQAVADSGIIIVFLNRWLERFSHAHIIRFDNQQAAAAATGYLAELGHRHIGWIGEAMDIASARQQLAGYRQQLAGYRQSLQRYGLPWRESLILSHTFRDPGVVNALDRLLHLSQPPTALIVSNPSVAQAVIARLRELRLSLPRDLSLLVYHDAPWLRLLSPAVGVMQYPLAALVDQALLRLMPQTDILPELNCRLIPRESAVAFSAEQRAG